jgi:uncharacterized protein (DUF1015 family)
MARLEPIRALRPNAAVAAQLSSVPYDVVSTAEARKLADGNPRSFLRVTRAELELPESPEPADPYAAEVYERGRANLERLKRAGDLLLDREPSLYVYRLRMGKHVQTGVAGGFSVDEYEQGTIKKHEKTRRDKEDDRTRHITTLRAQTGVVFLTYAASPAIDAAVAKVQSTQPVYDFVAPDGVAHTVWWAAAAERDALVAGFRDLGALYIADGHHRAASAWRARDEIRAGRAQHPPARGAGDPGDFLAVAFPDDQVQILPYHRLVKDLNGRSASGLLDELQGRFRFVDDAPQPTAPGRVSIYLENVWRTFELAPPAQPDSPIARLDCDRLQEQVLTPLLGIGDPRTDKRIDFVGGIRGTGELEGRVNRGEAAVAFAMYPVTVADLFAVSDAGEIMPPKSTWFEPKLRDGLLIHEI